MTTAIKRRRGTTAQHTTFTGLIGELTVDTDKKTVVVHDGATAGGSPLAVDSTVVHVTGAETIAGVKTFSSTIEGSISGNAGTTTTATNVSGGTASVTTLTTSSTVTHSGGTANGVAYLNGSKVLTTGSALTFDATTLVAPALKSTSSTGGLLDGVYTGVTAGSNLGKVRFYGSGSGVSAESDVIGYLESGSITSSGLKFGTSLSGTYGDKMYLNSSGNLGLGVAPSAWKSTSKALQVNGAAIESDQGLNTLIGTNAYRASDGSYKYIAAGNAMLYQQYAAAHTWYSAAVGANAGDPITFIQAMTLDASGNLLVGGTSATYSSSGRGLIEVNGSSNSLLALKTGGSAAGYVYHDGTALSLVNTKASYIQFTTNSIDAARIDSSGNLLVGTTSASAVTNGGLVLNFGAGESYTMAGHKTGTSSGAYFHACYYNNTLCGGLTQSGTTGVVLTSISDYRLKEDVLPMQDSLSKVLALSPVSYKWKSDGSDGEGFIAHELQAVIPTAATGEKDEVDEDGNAKYQGINLSAIVPHLVKAIQEQQAIIETLKARLDAANL